MKPNRDVAVLRAIAQLSDSDDDIHPAQEEIAQAVGLRYAGNITHNLLKLEANGYISRKPNIARSTRITDKGLEYLRELDLEVDRPPQKRRI
jgi:DNA-binding MarR family transcriptional regulator